MKKILVCVFILLYSSIQAQEINVGAKAGGNLYDNYESGTPHYTSQSAWGFHLGAFGDYSFSDKLFVRLEALYSTRGLHLKEPNSLGGYVEYIRESSYIDIPVSANYVVYKNITISAGVVTSIFLEEFRSETIDENGFKVEEGNQFKSYERYQLGAFVGASYPFELFGQSLEGGLRYSMGLTDTTELLEGVPASQDPKYMMVQAHLAIKLFKF